MRSSIAAASASGTIASRTSPLISSENRFWMTDTGALPLRNPGIAARFTYDFVTAAKAFSTSSAGTSISSVVRVAVSSFVARMAIGRGSYSDPAGLRAARGRAGSGAAGRTGRARIAAAGATRRRPPRRGGPSRRRRSGRRPPAYVAAGQVDRPRDGPALERLLGAVHVAGELRQRRPQERHRSGHVRRGGRGSGEAAGVAASARGRAQGHAGRDEVGLQAVRAVGEHGADARERRDGVGRVGRTDGRRGVVEGGHVRDGGAGRQAPAGPPPLLPAATTTAMPAARTFSTTPCRMSGLVQPSLAGQVHELLMTSAPRSGRGFSPAASVGARNHSKHSV